MRKRSRFTSKGWLKWQVRKGKKIVSRLVSSLRTRWRVWFPTQLSDDEFYVTLQRDVKDVQTHLTDAFRHRKIFLDTTEILKKHPTLRNSTDAGYWYDWLRTLYAHYIIMAVRRELDRGATSPNLYDLLHRIRKRPQVLSRDRYDKLFEGSRLKQSDPDVANKQFAQMAGSDEFIDPKIVRKDLDEVKKQARLVVLYANKVVAHRTAESVEVTLRHVNDSLETIEKVLQKYYLLLTASSLLSAEPSIISPWQRAFTVPWILSESEEDGRD